MAELKHIIISCRHHLRGKFLIFFNDKVELNLRYLSAVRGVSTCDSVVDVLFQRIGVSLCWAGSLVSPRINLLC